MVDFQRAFQFDRANDEGRIHRLRTSKPLYLMQYLPLVLNVSLIFSTNCFQIAISIILAFEDVVIFSTSTDKQPSTAS